MLGSFFLTNLFHNYIKCLLDPNLNLQHILYFKKIYLFLYSPLHFLPLVIIILTYKFVSNFSISNREDTIRAFFHLPFFFHSTILL